MRSTAHGLTALVFSLALGLQAVAAPLPVPPGTVIQAPEWSVGSSWQYSDGYGLKVSSNTGGTTVFERLDAPGQWFSRQGFLRKDLISATATRNSIFRTLPDQAGGSLSAAAPLTFEREYLSNGKLVVHASSWTLEGRETITVPAGTFDCWVIVWRTRSLKSDWTGFERWWYSPTAQNYVRMEYKYGPAEASSRVLMRYTLGQRADAGSQMPERLAAAAPALPLTVSPVEPPLPPAPTIAGDAVALPAQQEEAKTAEVPRPDPDPQLAPALALAAPVLPPADGTPAVAPAEPAVAPDPISVSQLPDPSAVAQREPAVAREAEQHAHPAQASLVAAPPTAVPARRTEKAAADANPPAAASPAAVWRVQLASSKDQPALRADFDRLLAAHADRFEGIPSGIASARIAGRGIFYRAWVGAFPSAREANRLCGELKAEGGACTVMRASADVAG